MQPQVTKVTVTKIRKTTKLPKEHSSATNLRVQQVAGCNRTNNRSIKTIDVPVLK